MLVRFAVNNILSFGELKEFTTIANTRFKTLTHHNYNLNGLSILKMSSIYGANGAGKSNLVNSLHYLQQLVLDDELLSIITSKRFKLKREKQTKDQLLFVEFIQEDSVFYYGIKVTDNRIAIEELYLSGKGKQPDKLVYERKTDKKGKTKISFSKEFESIEKNQVLKSVLLEEFVKPNKLVIKLLSKRDNKYFKDIQKAYKWFDDTLRIITPHSKYSAFAHRIDTDEKLKHYAEDILSSFDLGITSLSTDKKPFREFFGDDRSGDYEDIIKEVENSPNKLIGLLDNAGGELVILKDNGEIWVKELNIGHKGSRGDSVNFLMREESDGTVRLIDFIPAFLQVISEQKVFVIDEIERSLHPLLIKELITKFSLDDKTKGQLIFTTHESNLLDQNIFRQDEIWFTEKNLDGATDLYSLIDFKEHKTIDIRKGYLSGRYGSIPFLGNLKDLNWHE